jgi:hypothetical protein
LHRTGIVPHSVALRRAQHSRRTHAITITKWKEATLKALIVLVPTYTMAYFTGQMVWVVPMLAACGFFAGTISLDERTTTQRLDDDNDSDDSDLDETIETIDFSVDEDGSS